VTPAATSREALEHLEPADLASFAKLGIPPGLLSAAHVQRVSDREARDDFGITYSGDKSGIVFPYFIGDRRVTARLRRDNPEVDVEGKPQHKYIAPWGDRRHLYLPPGFLDTVKKDSEVAIVAVEAEKSALAGTAWAQRTGARLVFVALGGCWGWRGRTGKTESPNGTRVDVKGPLPDLAICDGRKVYILLDSNAGTQPKVQAAERAFVAELRSRKCAVLTGRIPVLNGVNGPDDLIAVAGDDAMADVIASAKDPEDPDIAGGIPVYSEGNLARRFAELHGETLRYTAQWDQWNIYDGCCWLPDLKLSVLTMANQLCHEAAGAIGNRVVARSVDALRTSTAVQTLARVLAPIPALAVQWDSDIWLLNTPSGAINLKLGDKDAFELRAGRAADYCTKMTAAAPGGSVPSSCNSCTRPPAGTRTSKPTFK
jgi:hypothetical protein